MRLGVGKCIGLAALSLHPRVNPASYCAGATKGCEGHAVSWNAMYVTNVTAYPMHPL